jgi:hypothetical protein
MGHLAVVLVDKERDEGAASLEGVEGVEKELLMLQGAPPRLIIELDSVTSTWARTR